MVMKSNGGVEAVECSCVSYAHARTLLSHVSRSGVRGRSIDLFNPETFWVGHPAGINEDMFTAGRVPQGTRTMKDEDEEEKHQQDMMKMVAKMKDEETQEKQVRVPPNMGAGGSHSQATSDPEEEKGEEQRIVKWPDCIDED